MLIRHRKVLRWSPRPPDPLYVIADEPILVLIARQEVDDNVKLQSQQQSIALPCEGLPGTNEPCTCLQGMLA